MTWTPKLVAQVLRTAPPSIALPKTKISAIRSGPTYVSPGFQASQFKSGSK